MKFLQNPITREVRCASALAAKSLARYGWNYVRREVWVDYQRAQVQLAILRNIPSARMGRVQ